MKKIFVFTLNVILFSLITSAQEPQVTSYSKSTYMIPMRDGIKLHTIVYTPDSINSPVPILLMRTPYGTGFYPLGVSPLKHSLIVSLAEGGYIIVYQDLRGRYGSEGKFEMIRPLYHQQNRNLTDESTDTYDAIEWLLTNIPRNNGKVGILGVSYPGREALNAISDPHPALKASSPQAAMVDIFLGDDFHHNGAFRLSYGFEYSYIMESKEGEWNEFPFPQYDLFDWYLSLGSLSNVNQKFFKNNIPSWNEFVSHPNYDDYWKGTSMLTQIRSASVPVLHIGGYYDQEDLNGPQIMYNHLEKNDSANNNFIILGPWQHGGWAFMKGDSLGRIDFGSETSRYLKAQQKLWFDYWLKGIGDGRFSEALCFQTGSNQWKSYSAWPPQNAETTNLFMHEDGTCDFEKPTADHGQVSYISDPAKPVPYRMLPIEATYGVGSRWDPWQVEDQRFVSTRPDVICFTSDTLNQDLTVTGNVRAHLMASTSETDADFVVKIIDVYPDLYSKNLQMSGYQFPVTMEVFRGRFRKSFETPQPFKPGIPEEIIIDLHQINHTFMKGHKIMVQVQSSWFPLIDRNPQKYVPNIFEATNEDFVKATHTIFCNSKMATYIELPVFNQ